MIFTTEQTRLIRQGKLTLAILHSSHLPTEGTISTLRRKTTDDNGATNIETIQEPAPGGDRTPVLLTILTVTPNIRIIDITLAQAKAAGHPTTAAFREHWGNTQHRATPTHATLVAFALGDWRDQPRLLSARLGRQDYTTTPALAARGEPEAITEAQHARLHRFTAAKDDARRRQPLTTLAQSLARDVDEIRSRMPEEGLLDRDTRKTLRALEHHADVLKRKLHADPA